MHSFFDRDVSWLSFNNRVLLEAASERVPILERLKFLAIFSSNMDEFYRVRIPTIMDEAGNDNNAKQHVEKITSIIQHQLTEFGIILKSKILPNLEKEGIAIVYNNEIPNVIKPLLENTFFAALLPHLQCKLVNRKEDIYVENNVLYKCIFSKNNIDNAENIWVVNIPSESCGRFVKIMHEEKTYLVFIDDIITAYATYLLPNDDVIEHSCNIKVTRNGALEIEGSIDDHLLETMEHKIVEREFGSASRFLYDASMPDNLLKKLMDTLPLDNTKPSAGGRYHNLKDFFGVPISHTTLQYPIWPSILYKLATNYNSLLDAIMEKDILIHPPYNDYATVLRFFGEAATNTDVVEIYTTLYRVASTSKIANALVTAAKNGKKVTVLVEIKARFDEANNVAWSKKLKKAGVQVVFSDPKLKVHAKIALVKKRNVNNRIDYIGMYATGNLNEGTAKLYTDHILMTANTQMAQDLEKLFLTLCLERAKEALPVWEPQMLLIAQYNLQQTFLNLIDKEIVNAKAGLPASIIIKMNNLEEQVLISKLYEASNAGVTIQLIVRSICCCIPGIDNMSANITVTRIVDKYLEHGRIFIFHNHGDETMYLGSSDWMNRNIYKRIEVCFPVLNTALKQQIKDLIHLQLSDNVQAVNLNANMDNVAKPLDNQHPIRSQEAIYNYVKNLNNNI